MELKVLFTYLMIAYKIIMLIPAILSLLIVIFMWVPGPQPEKFLRNTLDWLHKTIDWIEKYSKKPKP